MKPRYINLVRSPLLQVCQEVFESSPVLNGAWDDLTRRKNEAIVSSIPQLGGEGILDSQVVIVVVNAGSCGLVDSATRRSVRVLCPIGCPNGRSIARTECLELGSVWNLGRARIAVRIEEKLAVRMNIQVKLDTRGGGTSLQERRNSFSFRRAFRCSTLVILCAGIGGSTSGLTPSRMGPVPVDVRTIASTTGRRGRTVLTPGAGVGLSIHEAIGVDNREEVKIILLEVALNLSDARSGVTE